jgi:hypothetical protein
MSSVHGIMAEGLWHGFHDRTEQALQAFERAAAMVRRNWCVNSHMIVVIPMLAGALRCRAKAIAQSDPLGSNRLRRRALRMGKWGARITRFFPAAYPLALRELSLVHADRGRLRKAMKMADKSCAIAERQQAKYEYAQSLLVRARIAEQLGLTGAHEQVRVAEGALEECERSIREMANTNAGAP